MLCSLYDNLWLLLRSSYITTSVWCMVCQCQQVEDKQLQDDATIVAFSTAHSARAKGQSPLPVLKDTVRVTWTQALRYHTVTAKWLRSDWRLRSGGGEACEEARMQHGDAKGMSQIQSGKERNSRDFITRLGMTHNLKLASCVFLECLLNIFGL